MSENEVEIEDAEGVPPVERMFMEKLKKHFGKDLIERAFPSGTQEGNDRRALIKLLNVMYQE